MTSKNTDNVHDRPETEKERAGNVVTEMLKSGWASIVGWVLFLGVSYGVMNTNQHWNDARFVETEAHVVKNEARIATMESIGHPDHERRISKLELRTDNLDQKFSEMNAKLDTTIAILNRVEASLKLSVK